jgi:hypothetical protein
MISGKGIFIWLKIDRGQATGDGRLGDDQW